jgi:hypothetical protein
MGIWKSGHGNYLHAQMKTNEAAPSRSIDENLNFHF